MTVPKPLARESRAMFQMTNSIGPMKAPSPRSAQTHRARDRHRRFDGRTRWQEAVAGAGHEFMRIRVYRRGLAALPESGRRRDQNRFINARRRRARAEYGGMNSPMPLNLD